MLTADLAISWHRGGRTGPRLVATDDPKLVQEASDLIALFGAHLGRTRGELEQALHDYVGTGTDYKILRGFIKLLTDRCVFETATEIEPAEIRRAVFLKARAHHPVSTQENLRAQVVAEVASELGCEPEVVSESLYADLSERQRLGEFEKLDEGQLLDLYNLAQAQALLYRCVEMRLWVEPQSPEGYRELFGAIKAYRLIHTVRGNSASGYEIRLDGPVSMFQRSQKYGIQMAVFLPALLLCGGWRMRAEIASKPGSAATSFYELTSKQNQLRSHYDEALPYENPTPEKLAASWARSSSGGVGEWSLEPSNAVIDLGESAFIPDFVLRHAASGREVYLEILGFWTPRHLKEHLAEFEHARVENFLVAAWDELRGSRDPLSTVPPRVIVFKRSLDPAIVQLALDKLTSD